ncbi:hypothetical protein GCM10028801_06670 [Nocardioides maradonensis]
MSFSRGLLGGWLALVAVGTGMLVSAVVPAGPSWFAPAGAVVIAAAFTIGLAVRDGGRPLIFGGLATALGLVTVLTHYDLLHTGAAVLVAAVAAVFAVMVTVPTRGLVGSAREALIALVLAAIGGLAAIGFEPSLHIYRFEYGVLGLALLGAFAVVYRLGAGLHGLGRRGLFVVAIGTILLAVTLLYAELLRRYGSTGLVDQLLAWVHDSRRTLGAFPRPIVTLLGVPALVYGCHMRARRRQGWWVCAFGVAATAPAATALANPAILIREAGLSLVYGLVLGVLIGWLVIRIDLVVTSKPGRRRRAAQRPDVVRPEPARWGPLL